VLVLPLWATQGSGFQVSGLLARPASSPQCFSQLQCCTLRPCCGGREETSDARGEQGTLQIRGVLSLTCNN
jgi:hypothetical protein